MKESAGARWRRALQEESPLQIMGVVNAFCAMMANRVGYRALYLSGGACANMSYGLPDLGLTSMSDVLADAQRFIEACDLPLLVDIDTGWGGALSMARTVKNMELAGVAAVQFEDQVSAKRCGHRPNKSVVSTAQMLDRIKAAVDARKNDDFFLLARTDAIQVEGVDSAIERAQAYVEAGADGIFMEAVKTWGDYQRCCEQISAPVLANMTEFGQTPLFSLDELRDAGVAMALYPLTAVRAMNQAALQVFQTVREQGSQQSLIDQMQTREALYDFLQYHDYEAFLDKARADEEKSG